jgi:RNA recognition motif-containing protein
LIEYATKEEAANTIKELNDTDFMDNKIHVDWAFTSGSSSAKSKQK